MTTPSSSDRRPSPAGDVGTAAEHLFWPEPQWRALQSAQLSAHLRHALTTPFNRDRCKQVPSGDPLQFLALLPLTSKDHLAAAGASAWAFPVDQVAEWVCTSGTSGKPLDVPLTAADLARLAENEAVALSVAGLQRGDLFLMAVGMDRMFVAGLAYWLGAQKLGAICVRLGPQVAAHSEMLCDLIARVSADPGRRAFAITVPSFLGNCHSPLSPLAGIIGIGEPTRTESLELNTLSRRLHERFHCPILSTYAATETCTTFAESPSCKGGHLNPKLAVLEILRDDGSSADPGEVGEVVITPLGMQGLPLLRFQTGDLAAMFTDPCPCGRTTPRLGPILARKQHLLKIRGTSVYPSTILESLRAAPEVIDCVLIAEQFEPLSDTLTIHLHAHDASPATREKIESRLRALLRVTPPLHFVSEQQLATLQSRSGRKKQRFLDHRPLRRA